MPNGAMIDLDRVDMIDPLNCRCSTPHDAAADLTINGQNVALWLSDDKAVEMWNEDRGIEWKEYLEDTMYKPFVEAWVAYKEGLG